MNLKTVITNIRKVAQREKRIIKGKESICFELWDNFEDHIHIIPFPEGEKKKMVRKAFQK